MADPAAQRIWEAALGHLQLHVTRPNYDTWLKHTVGLRLEDGLFVVGTPTEFIREWLATRMRSLVAKTVSGIIGHPTEAAFEIMRGNGEREDVSPGTMPQGTSPAQAIISSHMTQQNLNPRYTFANFIVGPCNQLATAAAIAAAERPATDYNPLFIYGAPGLGKTHLLQAIAQKTAGDNRNSLYVTAEQFTNDFVTSLTRGRSDEFRRRYRSLRLLLVDDIQFLASKERTQEEFFYTFNHLHAAGCQVVIANDRPPSDIPGLERRLCSRFQWGLTADIQPPDTETRKAILQTRAREQHVQLPLEVAQLLADRAPDNIRELEGYLNRVVAYAHLTNTSAITLGVATRALAALTQISTPPPDPCTLIQAVSSYFHITQQVLASTSRARPIAEARHITMYLLREELHLPLKQIGVLLGRRDHSTVIHAVQKVSLRLTADPHLAIQLAHIRTLASH